MKKILNFFLCFFVFSCGKHRTTTIITQESSSTGKIIALSYDGPNSYHHCAIYDNSSPVCWGRNQTAQLGDGSALERLSFVDNITIPGNLSVLQVSVSRQHTCFLLDNSSITCWGEGSLGRLGTGSTSDISAPGSFVSLPGGRTAIKIITGQKHSCAILDNSSLSCWGQNQLGQVGVGYNGANELSPVDNTTLPGGRLALDVGGGSQYVCTLMDNGSVGCWGSNDSGQIGIGTISEAEVTPQVSLLPSGRTAKKIAVGEQHICAILDNSSVSCWGFNYSGQVGNGSSGDNATTPVIVRLPDDLKALDIAAGGNHSCAILENSNVACWGNNSYGQVGIGTFSETQSSPVVIDLPSGKKAIDLHLARDSSCALLNSSQVACWGSNQYGQVGDGSSDNKSSPTLLSL